jgi:hypothetical protein
LDAASVARVWDCLLGGSHNVAADRAVAEWACRLLPELPGWVWQHRRFVHRAVRYLLDRGVRQFLDLGSGLPTLGAVHQLTHRSDPRVRVVYVDRDPFVTAFTQLTLAADRRVGAVHADLRDPDRVLTDPAAVRLLDPDRPTGLLLTAAVDQLPDTAQAAAAIAGYHDRLAAGSWLVLTHATADGAVPPALNAAAAMSAAAGTPIALRTATEVGQLIDGFDPTPPGLVRIPAWQPEDPTPAAAGGACCGSPHGPGCNDAPAYPGYAVVAQHHQPRRRP